MRAPAVRIALCVCFLAVLADCSKSRTIRTANATLQTALTATDAAQRSFVAWDKAAQERILDASDDRAIFEERIAAHRAKQARVREAFTATYAAIATAAALVPLLEADAISRAELVARVAEAVAAVKALRDAITAIQGDP